MTFDEWANVIDVRVAAAVPDVCVKRKIEDVRRWIHGGRECQVHALSDSIAALVALRRNGIMTDCMFSCRVPIATQSEDLAAAHIIDWLASTP